MGGGPPAVLPVLWAWPLSVPVGGGPPARSPHASCARSGRSRGPPWPCRHPPAPRPGPATAHGHRSQALWSRRRPPHRRHRGGWRVVWCVVSLPCQAPPPPVNFARNSPATCSNIEFTSLELQRFRMASKSDRGKLCATFGQCWPSCRVLSRSRACVSQPARALLWCARCGEEALFWIGTVLLDSLFTYPERDNLSSLVVCASPAACLLCRSGGFARHEAP